MAQRVVGLLGATGYTGRLTAAELTSRGVPHVLGGRSESRLAAVPSSAERRLVDLDDPASLDAFLDGLDVVISCAGPFSAIGRPVVEAAVRNGVPYVDSTGELTFMRWCYETFGDAATAVVPGCGYDYVPGDCAAALAARELGSPVERLTIAYAHRDVRPTRGTARSAAGVLGGMGADKSESGVRTVTARFADGPRRALALPWGEQLTAPRHVPGATVETVFDVGPLALAAPVLPLALRAIAPVLGLVAGRLPEGPSAQSRARAAFQIVAEAHAASGKSAAVLVEGRDLYGLTAVLLVAAALRVSGAGAMSPAQALGDPAGLLDEVGARAELRWRVL